MSAETTARELLERYLKALEKESPGHAAFRLKSGEWREGHFEIADEGDYIVFNWAPSPFNGDLWMEDFIIPFEQIDLSSLVWSGTKGDKGHSQT